MTSMREQTYELIALVDVNYRDNNKEFYTAWIDNLQSELMYESNKGKRLALYRRIKKLSTQYQAYLTALACSECLVIQHLARFYGEPTPA